MILPLLLLLGRLAAPARSECPDACPQTNPQTNPQTSSGKSTPTEVLDRAPNIQTQSGTGKDDNDNGLSLRPTTKQTGGDTQNQNPTTSGAGSIWAGAKAAAASAYDGKNKSPDKPASGSGVINAGASGLLDLGKHATSGDGAGGATGGGSANGSDGVTPDHNKPDIAAEEDPSGSGTPVPPEQQAARQQEAAALDLQGDHAGAAVMFSQAGRPREAETQFKKALTADPKNAGALAGLSVVQAQQGRTSEAVETAKRALAVDPTNVLAKLVLGHSDALAHGDSATKKLSKLDLGSFGDPGALGGGAAGKVPQAGGQAGIGPSRATAGPGGITRAGPAPAPPVYDAAKPLTPTQQLVLKALRKHEIGDDQGAMLALSQAIDQDSKDAGAFVVRAEVDNSLRKFAETVIDATRAVDLAPTNAVLSARALRARAYARIETKSWVLALADASHAVDLDPQNALGYLYRALAEDKLGRGAAASEDLVQAVKLDPALAPLARPLLAKYGIQAAPAPKTSARTGLIRGGVVVLALGLVLFGLLGKGRSAKLTTTAAKRLLPSTPMP